MASLIDEFKHEARTKTGEVVMRKIQGWSFCLSYGAVDPRSAAMLARTAQVRVKVPGLGDVTDKVIEKLDAADPKQLAEAQVEMDGEWTLSAKLYPPGRSSTEKDWAFLGQFIGGMNIPAREVAAGAARIEKMVATETIYWIWRDRPAS